MRGLFQRYIRCHLAVKTWVRFAKFEVKNEEVTWGRTSNKIECLCLTMGICGRTTDPRICIICRNQTTGLDNIAEIERIDCQKVKWTNNRFCLLILHPSNQRSSVCERILARVADHYSYRKFHLKFCISSLGYFPSSISLCLSLNGSFSNANIIYSV